MVMGRTQSLREAYAIRLPDGVGMDSFAQGIDNRAIGLGECLPGVVGKETFLPGPDDSGLLEPGEVAAQVGLVEFQDCLKVTRTESPLMKKIQDAKSIWIGEGFQDT